MKKKNNQTPNAHPPGPDRPGNNKRKKKLKHRRHYHGPEALIRRKIPKVPLLLQTSFTNLAVAPDAAVASDWADQLERLYMRYFGEECVVWTVDHMAALDQTFSEAIEMLMKYGYDAIEDFGPLRNPAWRDAYANLPTPLSMNQFRAELYAKGRLNLNNVQVNSDTRITISTATGSCVMTVGQFVAEYGLPTLDQDNPKCHFQNSTDVSLFKWQLAEQGLATVAGFVIKLAKN